MKKVKSIIMVLVLLVMILPDMVMAQKQNQIKNRVDIIFTHDLHSHLEPFLTQTDTGKEVLGGFARIKTLIDHKREEAGELLVLDAGDFSMGTLYQSIFESEAAELVLLGQIGYDVTTLGNHEFDYTPEGLINMLSRALETGAKLPDMVLSNIDWEKSLQGEATVNQAFKAVWEQYGPKPYVMIEKNGVRIAVMGLFGQESLAFSPTCTLKFKHPIEAAKETVAMIEKEEEADMIVCVSHSGTWEDITKSEDEILAMQVPEIDLIVSGHTHTQLNRPIIHGQTAIVSCGEYGKYMGSLIMTQTQAGRWQIEDYKLTKVDSSIEEDAEIKAQVQNYEKAIDALYLNQFGYTKNQVLCYNKWRYPTIDEISNTLQEQPFANLLADAYLYTLEQIGEKAADEVMLSVVPRGVIRDVFPENHAVTVANVYDVLSLGKGTDGSSGYPLIRMYLTGEELKIATEIDASISGMMSTAQLFISGLSYEINPNRFLLNRATNIQLMDAAGNLSRLEADKLYPVVTDLYSGQMLSSVTDLSYGLIAITPKNAEGQPVENLEEIIITHEGKEIKAWVAVANYLESFGADGHIPEQYSKLQGRKVIVDDKRIGAIFKNPNALILKIGMLLIGVIVIIVIISIAIVKSIKQYKKHKDTTSGFNRCS